MEANVNQIKTVVQNLLEQARALWKYLLLYFYLPSFIVLLTVLVFTKINPSIELEDFFRDITALAEVPFYTGFVSQLGALLWAASVTSCFLALFALKKLNSGSPQSRRFLLHAGLFSVFLMLDDMFLFHEEIAPAYLSFGQKKVYLAYFLVVLAFLYFNRREILSSEYLLLLIAMAAFGLSIFLDVIEDTFFEELTGSLYETYEVLFEDGIKFIGIATWLAFYLRYIHNIFVPVFKHFKAEQEL
jgi:hypothetical protein